MDVGHFPKSVYFVLIMLFSRQMCKIVYLTFRQGGWGINFKIANIGLITKTEFEKKIKGGFGSFKLSENNKEILEKAKLQKFTRL